MRLKEMRKNAGVKVAEAAVAANVSPGTIYNWEAGRVDVPAHGLVALAALYGCSIDELFDDTMAPHVGC